MGWQVGVLLAGRPAGPRDSMEQGMRRDYGVVDHRSFSCVLQQLFPECAGM